MQVRGRDALAMQYAVDVGSTVTLHLALMLEDGTVAESTFDDEPLTFVMGDGTLVHGLELALYGLRPGDTQRLALYPEQAFGPHDPERIQRLPRAGFPADIELLARMTRSGFSACRAPVSPRISNWYRATSLYSICRKAKKSRVR